MTKENGEECRVYDMNATSDHPRVHEIGGRQYALISRGEGTQVPLEDAMQFLCDPAFVVLDAQGQQMKLQAPPRNTADFKLPSNQTIAHLDELTLSALIVRAKRLPGSEGMNKNTGKKRLVAFIMSGGVPVDVVTEPLDPDTVDLIESDDDDDGDTTTADAALEHESFPEV